MLLGMNNKHVSLVSPAKANSLPSEPPGKPSLHPGDATIFKLGQLILIPCSISIEARHATSKAEGSDDG